MTSHPIQYNAPLFRKLASSGQLAVKVFYTWGEQVLQKKYDPGFGKVIDWDIPLLEGYEYSFVKNVSTQPGTHHFRGMINPTLIDEIGQWKADSILVYGWNFHSHLACLRHFHGKTDVLFRGDSTLLNDRPGVRKLMRRIFLRWVYSHVDYALYVGTNNKDYYLRHGLKERQLIPALHAIDNDRFAGDDKALSREAGLWRNRLGIADDELTVLFAGKLDEQKNPFLILQLAELLKDEKIRFLFVGNGVAENELKRKAAGNPRVLFLDFQNQANMPLVYRLGDVFIFPSRGPETWGLAVNEAMACGRPVMVSLGAGCAPDLVEEGKNGIVFRSDDSRKCSQFIGELSRDREALHRMGSYSRQKIGRFSYDHIVTSLVGLLNSR